MIAELSLGRLNQDVPVALNRLVVEYDHVLICGPVFPHEVVGFSGGTKYLFPGIAASEIIHFTHWLGALITSSDVLGTIDTPVRAVINRAAALLQTPLSLLALVVTYEGVAGVFCGEAIGNHDAWRQAAALSARRHVVWLDKPFDRVLTVMPAMYQDLWTAAKGVYKTEPAIADGGEVVVYAPHVREASQVHGRVINEIGYHCRDYFLAQWDRFGGFPLGILAHSTHVKGPGTYDARRHVEAPRIKRHARHRYLQGTVRAPQPRVCGSRRGRFDGLVDRYRQRLLQGAARRRVVVPRRETSGRFGGDHVKYAMGVVGLGVMGANLARNIESRGFPVVGYDLDAAKSQAFVNGPAKGKAVAAADSPANLMAMLEKPRRILVMVPAGKPVDSVIAHLKPHLEAGDILIDGGNSYFVDTDRRSDELASGGLPFRRAPACRAARKAHSTDRRSCLVDQKPRGTRSPPS